MSQIDPKDFDKIESVEIDAEKIENILDYELIMSRNEISDN